VHLLCVACVAIGIDCEGFSGKFTDCMVIGRQCNDSRNDTLFDHCTVRNLTALGCWLSALSDERVEHGQGTLLNLVKGCCASYIHL